MKRRPRVDPRRSRLRRDLNDLVRNPEGHVSESKVWANIGKGICVYLLLAYTEEAMKTEYTLMTLLLFVIIPDLIKKLLSMRFGLQEGGKK